MLGHSKTLMVALFAVLAGCGTARLAEDAPGEASPDAGAETAELGCVVTISYPPSATGRALDVVVYDEASRLTEHARHFADGLVDVREWTWSEDGQRAVRSWFDGSTVTVVDAEGRIVESTTYGADGLATWRDSLSYDRLGRLESKVLTRIEDETPWIETAYTYDSGAIQQMREVQTQNPDEARTISYKFTTQTGTTKMVKSHDLEGDGHVDYKTAVLISDDGFLTRGVDALGQVVDYEYEGQACGSVVSAWQLADPFLVDM